MRSIIPTRKGMVVGEGILMSRERPYADQTPNRLRYAGVMTDDPGLNIFLSLDCAYQRWEG